MMRQRGYGLGAIFRDIGRYTKPVLNPVLEEVKDVGQTVGLKKHVSCNLVSFST